MKIYLASSWKNPHYAAALLELRTAGHDVYDFRDPEHAFDWKQIVDPSTLHTADGLKRALQHEVACKGFKVDCNAIKRADALVLCLPCGNDAHVEAGWVGGSGRPVVVYAPEIRDPGLMYKLFEAAESEVPLYATIAECLAFLNEWVPKMDPQVMMLKAQLAYREGQVEGLTEGGERLKRQLADVGGATYMKGK